MSNKTQVASGIIAYFTQNAQPGSTLSPMCRRILGTVAAKVDSLDWLLDASAHRTPLELSLLLTAGMHRQVLRRVPEAHSLRDYYPSVGGSRSHEDTQFPNLFLDVMEDCKDKLIPIIKTETVQTNETQRGLFWLFPAILTGWSHLHLVDLGASAGLNLVADQRRFTWSDGDNTLSFGAAENEQFVSQVRPRVPQFWTKDPRIPAIVSRSGCDLHPFPLKTEADRAKLESFVWPDQLHRFARLHEGIEAHKHVSQQQLMAIEQASLPHDLPKFLSSLDLNDDNPIVIYNTYMTTYLENEGSALRGYIDGWATSHNRKVMWVQSEPTEISPVEHHWCAWTVDLWEGKEKHSWQLGWVHPHGIEIDFLDGLEDFEAFFRK
jgi:hypothetical protein